MKLAFVGNFRVPYTTENDLVWSLRDLGHNVFPMQEDEWPTEEILRICIEQDVKVLMYVHTHTWFSPGTMTLDELWQKLEEKKIATASFHLDYWRGLAREIDVGTHPFWRTKYVFTADGGSHDWYREKGINHFWLPPGVVKRDCYWAEPKEEFLHDIIFVGSKSYHPEWQYRPQLIDWLIGNYGERFAHYGNDGRRVVRMHELNQLYRSAKVVVGDSLNLGFSHESYWSDRVTETLGRGGFLIHPWVKGMEKIFTKDKHFITYEYNDFDQLKEKIDYYLANYYEREKIRLEGHWHVKHRQTYSHRMEEMLKKITEDEKW